jgi:flagellar assembly protein FliH
LSNNLYKWGNTNLQQEEVRVIDVNAMLEQRMQELSQRDTNRNPREGFVSGLSAASVDIDDHGSEDGDGSEFSGNVIKAVSEDPEETLKSAEEEAKRILEEADSEATRILEEARQQAESEKQVAWEDAKRRGYEDGTKEAAKEAVTLRKQLQDKEKQLEEEYQALVDELEPNFVKAITKAYERIFHIELDGYRDILMYLISDTIRNVESSREFSVRISKEDYPFVSMQKKQIMAACINGTVEIVEDMSLEKNQCLIETENGIFDCGVDTQLEELTKRLRLLSYGK